MMDVKELRVGNIVNYDTGEGILPTKIDWQDLKWLTEKSEDFNEYHSPIELNDEWLLKFGFEVVLDNDYTKRYDLIRDCSFDYLINKQNAKLSGIRWKGCTFYNEVKYVHQLQNFFFALTGQELIVKGV